MGEHHMEFFSPFEVSAQQDFGYIAQDAQVPQVAGGGPTIERRTGAVPTWTPTAPTVEPSTVTPAGHLRTATFRWTPYLWHRRRWTPAAIVAADLPPAAMAALRRECEALLHERPNDPYLLDVARAIIETEQREAA